MFIVILIVIISLILLILFVNNYVFKKFVVKRFKQGNVIVAGVKGSGKDLVFQKVINCRKDYYYSNINYGNACKLVQVKDIKLDGVTFDNFINDNVVKTKHLFKENKDIYISDGGIYLPSYMDNQLYKKYPSFPVFYPLSRHLYNNNIHVNIQNFGRLWKALREQADTYIYCEKTIKLPFVLLTKIYVYDKYESAVKHLLPLKKRKLNKESKNNYDLYNAENGMIKKGYLFNWKHKIYYDTRAFEKIILKGKRKI